MFMVLITIMGFINPFTTRGHHIVGTSWEIMWEMIWRYAEMSAALKGSHPIGRRKQNRDTSIIIPNRTEYKSNMLESTRMSRKNINDGRWFGAWLGSNNGLSQWSLTGNKLCDFIKSVVSDLRTFFIRALWNVNANKNTHGHASCRNTTPEHAWTSFAMPLCFASHPTSRVMGGTAEDLAKWMDPVED